MFYDYPIRHTFNTPINTKFGGCILKYQQNVMRDTMLMIQNYEVEGFLEQWIKEFLGESLVVKDNREIILQFLIANPRQIFNRVWSNINKKHDTIYDKITIRSEDLGKDKILLSTSVLLVCEKYGINGPRDLYDNYTLEQYEWMLEGLRFHNYSQDKKFSIYNTKAMSKKYNEEDKNKKLMEYARKGPTKEFLVEYYAKNG